MSYLFPASKPAKRDYVPRSDEGTKNRHRAAKENFAIFLLRGMHSNVGSPCLNVLPFKFRKALQRIIEDSINEIKREQRLRMAKQKKEKSK